MRPLKAVILAVNKKTGLKIRTESGLIAVLPYNKKYLKGQKVLLAYNFIKRKITGILPDEHKIEDMPEKYKLEETGVDNDPENPDLELLEMG